MVGVAELADAQSRPELVPDETHGATPGESTGCWDARHKTFVLVTVSSVQVRTLPPTRSSGTNDDRGHNLKRLRKPIVKIFGLNPRKRYLQWRAVMAREERDLTFLARLRLRAKLLRLGLEILLVPSRRIPREVWRRRLRVCRQCPVFDRSLRRCRPWDGHPAGCGCFTPFLALVKRPYPKGCWGREFVPAEQGIGWE